MLRDRLIPSGVELRDENGTIIDEVRLRMMLAAEKLIDEQRERNAPVLEKAQQWGPVNEVHTIGDIQIAEVMWRSDGQTRYLIFVDGKDAHQAEESLDRALIYALCYKYDGYNTRAPEYIYRMIRLDEGRKA